MDLFSKIKCWLQWIKLSCLLPKPQTFKRKHFPTEQPLALTGCGSQVCSREDPASLRKQPCKRR